MRLKVCSAWLSAWNCSSGTHGSIEAHEDSVWLLLDVLHSNTQSMEQAQKGVRMGSRLVFLYIELGLFVSKLGILHTLNADLLIFILTH